MATPATRVGGNAITPQHSEKNNIGKNLEAESVSRIDTFTKGIFTLLNSLPNGLYICTQTLLTLGKTIVNISLFIVSKAPCDATQSAQDTYAYASKTVRCLFVGTFMVATGLFKPKASQYLYNTYGPENSLTNAEKLKNEAANTNTSAPSTTSTITHVKFPAKPIKGAGSSVPRSPYKTTVIASSSLTTPPPSQQKQTSGKTKRSRKQNQNNTIPTPATPQNYGDVTRALNFTPMQLDSIPERRTKTPNNASQPPRTPESTSKQSPLLRQAPKKTPQPQRLEHSAPLPGPFYPTTPEKNKNAADSNNDAPTAPPLTPSSIPPEASLAPIAQKQVIQSHPLKNNNAAPSRQAVKPPLDFLGELMKKSEQAKGNRERLLKKPIDVREEKKPSQKGQTGLTPPKNQAPISEDVLERLRKMENFSSVKATQKLDELRARRVELTKISGQVSDDLSKLYVEKSKIQQSIQEITTKQNTLERLQKEKGAIKGQLTEIGLKEKKLSQELTSISKKEIIHPLLNGKKDGNKQNTEKNSAALTFKKTEATLLLEKEKLELESKTLKEKQGKLAEELKAIDINLESHTKQLKAKEGDLKLFTSNLNSVEIAIKKTEARLTALSTGLNGMQSSHGKRVEKIITSAKKPPQKPVVSAQPPAPAQLQAVVKPTAQAKPAVKK